MNNNRQDSSSLFFILKRNRLIPAQTKVVVSDIYFQILFDARGAYIKVVDKKGRKVDTEYEYYSGYERQVLKALQKLDNPSAMKIDWDAGEGIHYLAENEFLFWPLEQCSNVIDEDFNKIEFTPEKGRVVVRISDEKDEFFQSVIEMETSAGTFATFRFLCETRVPAENRIFSLPPLGDNFQLLNYFTTRFFPNQLEKYLSLLYSYFDNLVLEFRDYTLINAEPRTTQPALIIEEVNKENALFLKVSSALEGFEPDFLEEDAELEVDNQRLSLFDVLDQYDRKSYITLSDGTQAIINREYILKLRRLFKPKKKKVKLSFFDLPLVVNRIAPDRVHSGSGNR